MTTPVTKASGKGVCDPCLAKNHKGCVTLSCSCCAGAKPGAIVKAKPAPDAYPGDKGAMDAQHLGCACPYGGGCLRCRPNCKPTSGTCTCTDVGAKKQ